MTDVDDLRLFCIQMQRELQYHRELLEQWLEVREDVVEIAENRNSLLQVLELRDGMQVLFHSAQVIRDMDARASELELALAGVSDNIARHGKALSSLTERQQKTTLAMDAVVRAVKRLDRSRPRVLVGAANSGRVEDFDAGVVDLVDHNQTAVFPSGDGVSITNGDDRCGSFCGHLEGGLGQRESFVDPDDADDWLAGHELCVDMFGFDGPRAISASNFGSKAGRARQQTGGSRRYRGMASVRAASAHPDTEGCARSVIARIEDALSRLDNSADPVRHVDVGTIRCTGTDPGGDAMMGSTASATRSAISTVNRRGVLSVGTARTSRSLGHAVSAAAQAPPNLDRNHGLPRAAQWLAANTRM